jgi:predicted ATPase/DNA-binding CsgD family transcriptional regulator
MYRQAEGGAGGVDSLGLQPPSFSNQADFLETPAVELMPGTTRQFLGGLPQVMTPLIGREAELSLLVPQLTPHSARPITITGMGGVGKTRLAIESATRCRDRFPDGVHFVSLAPVRNPDHVLPTIARGLGIQPAAAQGVLEALTVRLHEQRMLLVLDNFEQVIDAATAIGDLVAACPLLAVLITSRAPLRLESETIFQTSPLSLQTPDPGAVSTTERIPDAVKLFIDRGRQIDPAFCLDDHMLKTVLEICRRLEGLPLAIELAAARLRTVSPRELLSRLDPSLPLLSAGFRDLPERQQTLRATIAWSYDLLPEREQRNFRWLAVFVGGFRLPAAEAVVHSMLGATGTEPARSGQLLDSIDALIASNLVHRVPGLSQDSRYAMLEVVREYGLELLAARNELAAAQSAHVQHYSSIREWLDPNRFQPDERFIDHLWDIDAEFPNLRVALSTCEKTENFERMLDIAGAMAVFCHHRGYLGEGRFWLERSLAAAEQATPEARGWGLAGLGLLLWTQSDALAAEPVLLEALELANQLDHTELRALSLHLLALVDLEHEELTRARGRIEEALQLWRVLDLPSDEAMALHILGWISALGGDLDRGLDDARACLAIFDSIGYTGGVGHAQQNIGRLEQRAGNERSAYAHFALAVSTMLSIDDRWAINRPLVSLADLATRHRQFEIAATLIGVIHNRQRLSDSGLGRQFRKMFDQVSASIEGALGHRSYRAKRRAGSGLAPEEINALIAELGDRIFSRPLLSHRETQVLQRIAASETDREIADALFVSLRTVHTHVSHILTKLEVSSRRDAVRRARELGLLSSPHSPTHSDTTAHR